MDADVVVVGAGAAGLIAARRLARAGLRVVVLEARDRAGGRVAEAAIAGLEERVELGAEFIHGNAPQTMALLREADMQTVPIGDDRDFAETATLFAAAAELPSDMSVDDYLERFESSDATRHQAELARAFVEGFDAADPSIASVKGIAEEVGSGVDFSSARPDGGYAPMFGSLLISCAAAGVDMRWSTPVREIAWKRGGVTIACASERLTARAVVITVPAGVLQAQAVRFEPPLPHAKLAALAGIEMGPVVKVNLAFANVFWDSAFYRSAGLPFGAYWSQAPKRTKMLVAWAGGPRACALLARPNDDIVDVALSGLSTILGDVVRRDFIGAAWHNWEDDPFSRGAYSYVRAGAMGSRETLALPVDDALFFAGEATAAGGQGGTVHGALASGERAAGEVEEALC